jgi:AcrR family transcriptional regulator
VISQSETDKRNEILQAALKLFVEFGFHGTPTSKIAQTAGVANGTLFHYFKTKEELITCLYIDLKTKLNAFSVAEVPESGAGVKEKTRCGYLNALHWALQNPEGFRFIQQFSNSPFLSLISPEEIKKQSGMAFALIGEGLREKIIKPLPPDLIYTMVSSHIYGMSEYLLHANLTDDNQAELINDSFEMVWKMVT